MHDLVIRGGTLVDGTGGPRFKADIAIDGDRITAVGTVGPGRRELDATGRIVTPGWVDMHTHYDGQVTWDPWLTPSGWHGVTTVVMGNCGVGFAPVREADRDWLIGVMEGVEDIPGAALHEGIRWGWETFPEYLDVLDALPLAIDVATQVPHSALRAWVMGRDRAEGEPSTAAEQAEMKRLVAEALAAGALGFSTSRTPLHKTIEGVVVAGTHADHAELATIAEALGEANSGVFELANEHNQMRTDIGWLTELARSTGRPVVFNLSQIDEDPTLWRDLLASLEAAAADGVPLYGQVAGRAIGLVETWRSTAHPFKLTDTWASISHLTWPQQLERLREPAFRAEMIAATPLELGPFESFVTRCFARMFPMGERPDYEPDPADSIGARADRDGTDPVALAYDALMANDGLGQLYFPLFNWADGNLDPLHTLHSHSQTRMGLSDGGAHCGAICDAGMPTFMITHWTRDRRGPRMSLEHVVHRQTASTAAFYGLHDRGIVAAGYRADLNILDLDALHLQAPEMRDDLPAGGRRLVQRPGGYCATVCSGRVIHLDGEPTGELPGRLVRGGQPAPVPKAAEPAIIQVQTSTIGTDQGRCTHMTTTH